MKVHLINAPWIERKGKTDATVEVGETKFTPYGVLYLAGYLRESVKDVEIRVTDGLVEGVFGTLKKAKQFSPDIVGISSTTANSTGAYQFSHLVRKELPDTLIVMGGTHATSMPMDVLKRSAIDLVIIGEGELVFTEIVKKYAKVKSRDAKHYAGIKGLAYLEKGVLKQTGLMPLIQNIDDIPFPARDLIDMSPYKGWVLAKKQPETNIFSTRGCPFNCTFCSNPVWKVQKPWIRLRSPGNIMDEVEEMRDKFGFREYFDQSDEMNSSVKWAIRVAQEKVNRKIDMPWKAQMRADLVTEELAKNLAKSNLWYVHLGIESGNESVLKGIGKNITLEQVIRACRLLKKYNIKVAGLFMLFNIWEENGRLVYEGLQETRNTLKFAKKLLKNKLVDYISWTQTTPYPGSRLWDIAVRHNIIKPEYMGKWENWNEVWSFVVDLPGVSERDKMKIKVEGELIRAMYALKGGVRNLNNLGFVMKKGFAVLKNMAKIPFAR